MSVPWYLMAKGKGGVGYKTASGPIVSVNDALAAPLRSLLVNVEPVQEGSGDPSPDNVRPISGWNAANLWRTGKNVWDEELEIGGINNNTGQNNDAATTNMRSTHYVSVKPGEKYRIVCGAGTGGNLYWYDREKNFIYHISWAAGTVYTVPSNAAFARFVTATTYGTTYNHDISINYPSTDQEYRAYSGTTYPITIPALGKNLLSTKLYTGLGYNPSIGTIANFIESADQFTTEDNETYTITIAARWSARAMYCPVKPGTTYEFKRNISSPTLATTRGFLDKNYAVINTHNNTDATQNIGETIISPDNAAYFYCIITNHTTANATITVSKPQLELGSTATAYEPYTNTVYGGYISVSEDGSAELVVTHGKVLLPSTGWAYYQTAGKNTFNVAISGCKEQGTGLCDRYTYSDIPYIAHQPDKSFILYRQNASTVKISICDNDYTDASVFGDSVEGAELVYELATPITIPLSDITISTLKGQNVVWGDCGDVTLEYLASGGANADLMKLAVAFMGKR